MSRCVAIVAFWLVMLASAASLAQETAPADGAPSTSPAVEQRNPGEALNWVAKIGALAAVLVFIVWSTRKRDDDERSGRPQSR